MLWAAVVVAIGGTLPADDLAPGFKERVFHDAAGDHKYIVFLPAAYSPAQKWPMILYLHGGAERGTDPRLPVIGGMGPQIRARAETFPFIVVFPQCEDLDCRAEFGWRVDGPDAQRALKIADEVEREFTVDRAREVITGASMGGFGTWAIAATTPARWSAVVPLAATGDPAKALTLAHTPIWAFHGARDVLVTPGDAQRMIDAVRAAGGRAYLTVLPDVRHNVLSAAYNNDALYEWMLNPQSEPRPESFVQPVKQKQSLSASGRDFQQPFVPGVEVPQAMLVQIDREMIATVAETLPDLVPADALSARAADITTTRPGLLGSFQLTLSGISYRGSLERVVIEPRDDGWLSIALGLRNVIGQVDSAEVRGRLLSASAGPMDVIAGQSRPIWLKFDVRPVIVDRRLHFDLGAREFVIPNDDFHVTTPQVVGRGIPIVRNRFSSTVADNLVSGAYSRKSEIEQRVLAAVPMLVGRLEQAVETKLAEIRIFALFPTPAFQPRFKMWPESLHVDHTGISLIVGAVIGQPGLYSVAKPVHRIEADPVNLKTVQMVPGLTFGLSSSLLEGMTASVTDVAPSEMRAHEVPLPDFEAIEQIETITKLIPDLARYGNRLRVCARLKAFEAVSLRPAAGAGENSDPPAPIEDRVLHYDLNIPHVALLVDIKTSPEQKQWQPCAEFDVKMSQKFNGTLERPEFSKRVFSLKQGAPVQVAAQAHFVEGYQSLDPTLHAEPIAEMFRNGWQVSTSKGFMEGIELPDRSIGSANLRLARVDNVGHFIAMRYLPATTRITNATAKTIVYQVRGPHSGWGGPYSLEPLRSHDFATPYPITLRSGTGESELNQLVPMGTNFVFGKDDQPATTHISSVAGAEPARN
jgi:poly(3-hydroxybutyrate) depolymerase